MQMLMSAWKIMESVNMSAIIHQDRTTVDAVTNITWVKMEEAALVSYGYEHLVCKCIHE